MGTQCDTDASTVILLMPYVGDKWDYLERMFIYLL
jgi:hypothetical protein